MASGFTTALGPAGPRRGANLWLTALLDRFLSESLRTAPPSELHRHRVLIGATLIGGVLDISVGPILGGDGGVVGATVFGKDITARKLAETRLGEMHRSLVEVSRYAGRAEVATGVLHNVGNTLNSVNTSANLIEEKLRLSRVPGLRKAAVLLEANALELPTFFSSDPRGRQMPGYLLALAGALETERESLRLEVDALMERIEHIKSAGLPAQRGCVVGRPGEASPRGVLTSLHLSPPMPLASAWEYVVRFEPDWGRLAVAQMEAPEDFQDLRQSVIAPGL